MIALHVSQDLILQAVFRVLCIKQNPSSYFYLSVVFQYKAPAHFYNKIKGFFLFIIFVLSDFIFIFYFILFLNFILLILVYFYSFNNLLSALRITRNPEILENIGGKIMVKWIINNIIWKVSFAADLLPRVKNHNIRINVKRWNKWYCNVKIRSLFYYTTYDYDQNLNWL
jgi:hypothetical protein